MEKNKFFKLIWRFNGLLISVAGVLANGQYFSSTLNLNSYELGNKAILQKVGL